MNSCPLFEVRVRVLLSLTPPEASGECCHFVLVLKTWLSDTMRAALRANSFRSSPHQRVKNVLPGSKGRRNLTTCNSSMSPVVHFTPTASNPNQQPTLPRSGACAATLPASHSHDAIMFGGYTEEQQQGNMVRVPTNEAWLLSKASGAWGPVKYSSEAVPCTRLVAQCVVVGDKLWLIGGWDSSKSGPEAFLGDVWTLDLQTWAWAQQHPTGEQLQGISRFQAVADGTRILIHTHRTEDHILALHTDSSPPRLEKVPVNGPGPASRGLHSVVKLGRALYLYGGAPQKGPMMDDLWKLELDSMQWQQLQPAGVTPHARCSPAAAAVGKYVLYFGGAFYGASGGLEMLGDVHLYDTESNSWVKDVQLAPGATAPAARNAAVMVPLPSRGCGRPQLLLSGGWRAFVETYNDSYLVEVE